MSELFRYMEQTFVVPATSIDAIDVIEASDFQNELHAAISAKKSNEDIQEIINDFIAASNLHAPETVAVRNKFIAFYNKLPDLQHPDKAEINKLFESIFLDTAPGYLSSEACRQFKRLLNDVLIAAKLSGGIAGSQTSDLVKARQALNFIEVLETLDVTEEAIDIHNLLRKPVLVPADLLKKQSSQVKPLPTPPKSDEPSREALQQEHDKWKKAYDTLMAVRPDQLDIKEESLPNRSLPGAARVKAVENKQPFTEDLKTSVRISPAAFGKIDKSVMRTLETDFTDIKTAEHSLVIDMVKKKVFELANRLDPCDHVRKAETTVYRLGVNVFAVKTDPSPSGPATVNLPDATPDFSKALTKPLGIGNLQVVRQQLTGYSVKEVSHIENVLQGEVLRHSTIRKDVSESTLTDITQTTQFEERDLQSTVRNELVAESQRESGRQEATVQGQTTTTNYGKLVANDKASYAKSVTDRAVNSLTQQVTKQRVQHEKKVFVEKSLHEFNNAKVDAKNITGVYQWVDKTYKTRILNYGARLLYDVVVPEPAAFLIETLKNAPRSEDMDLRKPDLFDLCPNCLNAFNYGCLAAKYGVTGAVAPPPDEFVRTVVYLDSSMTPPASVKGYGQEIDSHIFKTFEIKIPDGYQAYVGYYQMVNANPVGEGHLEFYLGERYNKYMPTLSEGRRSHSFSMNGETGSLPLTFRTHDTILQYSCTVGIHCIRTEKGLEEWQLKTHAALMAGYNRQLADYQDKLSRLQSTIRAQLANAGNYAHNPAIEQAELKKAFIYLLLSEHFNYTYKPTPDPEMLPTDPVYLNKWGAMVAFFERAFEWENIMYTYYPYYWARRARWGELILIQDLNPQFEEFLKAGAARVVVPVRPGFELALAHYHETGDIWMGEEMPDMFSEAYISILQEMKARNYAPGKELLVEEWEVTLPTTLVILKEDGVLPATIPA